MNKSKIMEVEGENLEGFISRQKFQVFFFSVSSCYVIPFCFFAVSLVHMLVCCLNNKPDALLFQ